MTAPPAATRFSVPDARPDSGRDELMLRETEIYLKYPSGVAASKQNSTYFKRVLGTPATVSTWRVVTRLGEPAS